MQRWSQQETEDIKKPKNFRTEKYNKQNKNLTEQPQRNESVNLNTDLYKLSNLNSKAKKHFYNDKSLKDLWENTKRSNIDVTGVAEGEEKECSDEKITEEILTGNFPNLAKDTNLQIQWNSELQTG